MQRNKFKWMLNSLSIHLRLVVFIFLDFHGSQSSLNSLNDDFNDMCDDEWDDMDDTFTADYSSDEDTRSVSSNCSIPVACVALYNFDVCVMVYGYWILCTCLEWWSELLSLV